MRLTVKQLKEKINDLPDETEVFIERVEDIYFEKHGWDTKRLIFQKDENGIPFEYHDFFNATQAQTDGKSVFIYAHY